MKRKVYPPDFERLYLHHPKKSDKGAALKAYIALEITGEDVDWLIPKVQKYAKLMEHEGREKKYIKSLGPWLNGCIDDVIELPETQEERWAREEKEMKERRERLAVKQ